MGHVSSRRAPHIRKGVPGMSLTRSFTVALLTFSVFGVLLASCSSEDDGGTATSVAPEAAGGAPAAADTPVPADTEVPVEVVETYELAQQFELSLNVTSTKFNRIRRIPRKYSCTEEDISPPISWSEPPEGTVSLALVVDSNQHPGALWAHWLLWGIPPDSRELPEAVPGAAEAPSIGPNARQGTNSEDEGRLVRSLPASLRPCERRAWNSKRQGRQRVFLQAVRAGHGRRSRP